MEEPTTLPRAGPSAPGDDPRTDILRRGARTPRARAIEAEGAGYLPARAHLEDEAGRRQVARNGRLPERTILTGVGPVEVQPPRVRDRRPADPREAFTSAILPPYLRQTRSLEGLIPGLDSKGVRAGDSTDALKALLGPDAPGTSATTVTRPKAGGEAEDDARSERSLSGKRYAYVRADGVRLNIRPEGGRPCIPVPMGATADGEEERIAGADGYRESERSRKQSLPDVKARGREVDPAPAIGDGASGSWKAVRPVRPSCPGQRRRAHETADVLDELPGGAQPEAEAALHAIPEAEGREGAERAFDLFVATYEATCPKAVECLARDREALPASYGFPAEPWRPIRATDPIESTFATVRLRHGRTEGNGRRAACLALASKRMEAASGEWRVLNGSGRLKGVIRGVKFVDGVEVKDAA